ncbi:hypothetical protein [Pseudomonas sp. L13]|uniref:hypothetical protein n=1 Tax=Pseudomonas sp. L13 TaxID=343985 RepID=UPI001379D9A8|nr:hypothetical protein [Pseudomonas sp. L13]NCE90195.1 hypothetical protein [Pseudomonas sp. L13]
MVAHTSNCRLAGFGIRRAAWSGVADGLYANGRHQYEVIIDVVKEVIDAKGEWVQAPLTDEERASVTVVEWSENYTSTLMHGWHCDEQRNEFTLGLWRGKAPEHEQRIEQAKPCGHSPGESTKRYLRCDPDVPIGSAVFMARVMIEGVVYTTWDCAKTQSVDSSITLHPVRPIELDAAELENHIDLFACTLGHPYFTSVHVYYWMLPQGLSIVKNLGFDEVLGLPGEGENFQSVLTWHSPMDSSKPSRVGTFINKDYLDASLNLDEIHHGLPAPSPNLPVRFNERPTLMRAIRLISTLPAENRDMESVWRLLDNYGNEHTFSVMRVNNPIGLPEIPFFVLKGKEIPRKLKITHFKIMLASGEVVTSDLYANGRHQCKVVIEIIVELILPDGSSMPVRLSDTERKSVTVTRYSPNSNEPLPSGWNCDQQKNIYDTGRWNTRIDNTISDQYKQVEVGHAQRRIEVIERYLRFDPNIPIEEHRFMASVNINGVIYTTNSREGDVPFDSFVTIRPVMPYRLYVRDLTEYIDDGAYHDEYYDMDVYYWAPPDGLRFLVNRGFDAPLVIRNEGLNFQTSYFYRRSTGYYRKGGVVMNKDVVDPVVSLDDIFVGAVSGSEKIVRFSRRSTIMRAVRAYVSMPFDKSADSESKWRLWDNFGCEHVFRLEQHHDGDRLKLVDG